MTGIAIGVHIAQGSIAIDVNQEEASKIVFTDSHGAQVMSATTTTKTTSWRLKELSYYEGALVAFAHLINNSMGNVDQFAISINDDAMTAFTENVTKLILDGFEDILKNFGSYLKIDSFVAKRGAVDQDVLLKFLPHMEPGHLKSMSFVGGPGNTLSKIDLHDVVLLPQWKHLKEIFSEFPIMGSHWDQIEVVEFKVPKLEKIDIERLIEILSFETCKTNRVHLDARHLCLDESEVETIMGTTARFSSHVAILQLGGAGVATMENSNGVFVITRG